MSFSRDINALHAALVPRYVASSSRWVALAGGRSNRSWCIDGRLVCKLFRPERATSLFPNDSVAEARVLTALAGTGLAPRLVGDVETYVGHCLLYHYVRGAPLAASRDAFFRAGAALRRLHCQPIPGGLRVLRRDVAAIIEQAQALLAECESKAASALMQNPPSGGCADDPSGVFLHGDPVPANIIDSPAGIVFIDWQCPAVGDACEDIAIFLSPAMQCLYGAGPVSDSLADSFLAGYGADDIIARYRIRAPFYHYRLAAYCLWQAERGAPGYEAAARAELAKLPGIYVKTARPRRQRQP
ncbi:MAG: aminoglycoside phosphotransferase family protein [Paracoccaceae bacterium]